MLRSQPKYSKESYHLFVEHAKAEAEQHAGEAKEKLRAEKVYEILRHISDEDCKTLGFNPRFSRPENLIMTVRGCLSVAHIGGRVGFFSCQCA